MDLKSRLSFKIMGFFHHCRSIILLNKTYLNTREFKKSRIAYISIHNVFLILYISQNYRKKIQSKVTLMCMSIANLLLNKQIAYTLAHQAPQNKKFLYTAMLCLHLQID